ncbi:flagellar biosynthesis protein FlhF [Muricoccus vinaceus]|uniref:Flagellar biosynthesis protein FlhF n=1 Tax=Muricoccus vinaceus TaxID=424704 RepID=A0ABV6ISR7_9PROT
MRVRVVHARTMPEAMRMLTEELGPNAVLLSSRRVAGGFQATGGLETDPPEEPLSPALPISAPGGFDLGPTEAELPRRAMRELSAGPGQKDGEAAALGFHGIPEELRTRLLGGPLEAMLSATLRFGRLPELGSRPLLLAGPPGAGKTLTTMKLAARHVLGGGEPPLIVNTDQQRPGAAEQLTGVAELLKAHLAQARNPAAALQAIALRPPGGAVLIDTSGMDPFDADQARLLLTLIATTRANVALVMPCGLDPAEASELGRAFRALGATHLVPTRLEATRRLGGIISAAAAADLVLSEGGASNLITEGLMALSPDWLAERLRRQTHAPPRASPSSPTSAAKPEEPRQNGLLRFEAVTQNGDPDR